jgi:ribosomal protein S18 acetylase RimI-like enzyme
MRANEFLTELRDRMYQYIKSIVPTWPDYVVQDWLYKGGKTDTKDDIIEKILGAGLTPNSKWQLVSNMKFTMDMFDPMTKQRLIGRAGGTSDLGMGIPKDKERHATQAALAQQQGGVRKEPVLLIKTAKGYELLEGWHRTIQHFAKYPEGYTGPAYVAVAQGQQGVVENMDHSKDHQAVEELKAALVARKQKLQSASDDQVYDSIDKIMTRIAKTHSISGQKLHDMWVDRYKQVPDTWIMNEDASGIDFDMQFDDDTGSFATVTARAQGRTLGSVKFFMDGDTLEADMVEVDERYRGQGIAAAMYDYAKSQGYTIEKSSNLTPDGDHFWNKNRGEEPVWEQGMAENFADGKKPGRKGLAKRMGVNTKASVSSLRKTAKNSSGEKQRMAHWLANMKAGRKK